MLINAYDYNEEKSASIYELIPKYNDKEPTLTRQIQNLNDYAHLLHNNNYPALFQKIYGRQTITIQYTRRNWIWSFTTNDGKTTIYTLVNLEGITLEYYTESDTTKLTTLIGEITNGLRTHLLQRTPTPKNKHHHYPTKSKKPF